MLYVIQLFWGSQRLLLNLLPRPLSEAQRSNTHCLFL